MDTGKLIGYAVGILIALLILQALLPYLVVFLALCGAWHLFQEHSKWKF